MNRSKEKVRIREEGERGNLPHDRYLMQTVAVKFVFAYLLIHVIYAENSCPNSITLYHLGTPASEVMTDVLLRFANGRDDAHLEIVCSDHDSFELGEAHDTNTIEIRVVNLRASLSSFPSSATKSAVSFVLLPQTIVERDALDLLKLDGSASSLNRKPSQKV